MSQPDQPTHDASIPTHDDIQRIRQLFEKIGPWSYSELVQMIGFLEGLPTDQLPPSIQAQVEEVLQDLYALMRPLLQQHVAAGLQELAKLLQNLSAAVQEDQGMPGDE